MARLRIVEPTNRSVAMFVPILLLCGRRSGGISPKTCCTAATAQGRIGFIDACYSTLPAPRRKSASIRKRVPPPKRAR